MSERPENSDLRDPRLANGPRIDRSDDGILGAVMLVAAMILATGLAVIVLEAILLR